MGKLLFIFGPPASGKAAIGHAVAQRTGYRFFHNHLTADPVAAVLGFDHPRFGPTTNAVRDLIFQEAVADATIQGLIFTFVWALNSPEDQAFVERTANTFEGAGWPVSFVELLAPLEVRIAREGSAFRVDLKPALRDVQAARSRQVVFDQQHRMNTRPNEWPEALQDRTHLRIDTQTMDEAAAAELIIKTFGLKT